MNATLHAPSGRDPGIESLSEPSRGQRWMQALAPSAVRQAGYPASVAVADGELAGAAVRWIALVPDPDSRFPRAREAQAGLLEGWSLARAVHEAMDADRDAPVKRAIVAIVDTPSQAYGRREEAFGIHQALAGAAAAYAQARLAGHPVVALIVGRAMSGAFLAHGYQANRIIALNDSGVLVHAMGREAAARITMRTVDELETLASSVPPMAYDIGNFASLGLLWKLLDVSGDGAPAPEDARTVLTSVTDALAEIRQEVARKATQGLPPDLAGRRAGVNRQASAAVRACLARQWDA